MSVESFLGRVGLLREADDAVLKEVAAKLSPLTLDPGGVLCREGEVADRFYLVRSGTLSVTTRIGDQERELTRLFSGDFLGEIALLGETERTATVTAISPAELLTMDAADFKQLLADVPALEAIVAEAARQRQSRSLRAALEVEQHNLAVLLEKRDTITIGRAGDNDLVFGSMNVAEHHARLHRRKDDSVELVDLATGADTFVNGSSPRGTVTLKDGDEIVIGDQRFFFSRTTPITVMEPRGIRIDVLGLSKEVRGGKKLLNDLSTSILPGEFVGIVGGSGAGKTTLMDAMAGLRPATSGTVLYNGRDYYRDIEQYRHVLGYVPQDDIIHADLTLKRTLLFAARLRLPRDTSRVAISQAVDRRMEELGLASRADLVVDKLSGGQRKRASIAIELLTEPRVFYLDEPTSGLDPATDRSMMHLLRQLADDGRTVVLTTHATKNVGLCDKIVVLARDGHMAYMGPPAEALTYFDVADFDEIYDRLEEGTPAEWGERFRSSQQYGEITAALPAVDAGREQESASAASLGSTGGRGGLREFFHQLKVLSKRNLVLHVPPQNLMPLLMQPVVITLLILSLFRSGIFNVDEANPNTAMQMIYTFDFVMFLFGLLFGAQEIVKESSIFRRERTVGVKVLPYVLSKATFLAPLLAVVATAMTAVFWLTNRLPDAGLVNTYVPLVFTLILTGWAGMAMSLLISSVVRTSQQATDLLTPWIAPQVLFAGALFAVPSMNVVGRALSNITAVRWAFEASSNIVDLKELFAASPSSIGAALLVEYRNSFNSSPATYWGILALFVVIPLVLAGVVLTKKTKAR